MPQMVVNKEFEALIKDMDKQKDKSIKCGTQHSQTVRLSKNLHFQVLLTAINNLPTK